MEFSLSASKLSAFKNLPVAPIAAKRPVTDTRHGITRSDDYAWMRDDNWQAMFKDPSLLDPAIRVHLEAENFYQQAAMADTEELRKTLFAEMRGRIKEDDSSVPSPDGAWLYGVRYVTGGEQPKYFRIPRGGGDEQVTLDGDHEAEGKPYFRLAGTGHSPDHTAMIWGYDDKGSEFFTLKVRDLATGEDGADLIENTGGGAAWASDCKGFFYTAVDDNHRPSKIFYHRLATPQSEDVLVHEETDTGFFMGVSGSRLNDFIMIGINDHETSECWVMPADDPQAKPQLVAARKTGIEYSLSEGGDVFYILTNADGAKDFKIMQTPVGAPGPENWSEVVPHKPGRLILSVSAYRNHLVWMERENGLPRIVIRDRISGEEHAIAFDEEAYSLGFQGSMEYDTDIVRFSYSSMTTPSELYDYNMTTRERTLLKRDEVPSGHNPGDYVTRRVMAPPMTARWCRSRFSTARTRSWTAARRACSTATGPTGSIPASFNTNCLSLVDRGFVYAIAHIRGGKEKGFAWYEEGKRGKKTNTFTDFIAAARYLDSENFTSHERIVAQGGSAGGMLMGAVANMAPEAFGAIIAAVPFVDVLNTMLDDTLPLTPPEWPEWGNPVASVEDYRTIAAYSPYDNVTAQAYPPILAVAGLTDPRVTYWEPAKWVARLRQMSTSGNPVLFKINMAAGHAGASGRFQRLEEIAYEYAFALKVVGKV
jgi:oligopeptidase B